MAIVRLTGRVEIESQGKRAILTPAQKTQPIPPSARLRVEEGELILMGQTLSLSAEQGAYFKYFSKEDEGVLKIGVVLDKTSAPIRAEVGKYTIVMPPLSGIRVHGSLAGPSIIFVSEGKVRLIQEGKPDWELAQGRSLKLPQD
ncbi:MAG TPA: hypothetical protein PK876_04585 [Elusimicrobiota bacterium]|nr:hypothetical protein [Elusimicrobiota bacterium]